MPRPSTWSDDELAALLAIPPGKRGGIAAFCKRFPARSPEVVSGKLALLRARRQARDVVRAPMDLRLKQRAARAWAQPEATG